MTDYSINILHGAIVDHDKELQAQVIPAMFTDKNHRIIYEYIQYFNNNKIMLDYEHLRYAVNEDKKLKDKIEIHNVINYLEKAIVFYTPKLLQEFVRQYHERVVVHLKSKLEGIGSGYTVDNAIVDIDKANAVIKLGYRDQRELHHAEIINTFVETSLNPPKDEFKKLIIVDPNLQGIFGKHLHNRLYIIGGLPSMSKNIIADNLVAHISDQAPGVYFAFDNSKDETAATFTCIKTGISYRRIIEGSLTDVEWQQVRKAKMRNEIYIVDEKMTIDRIALKIGRLKKQNSKISWFVIDYFQNIPVRDNNNIVREYEFAAIAIKDICREYKMTAIILSQSNGEDKPEGNRFSLSNMKWCSGLGQEAFFACGMEGKREETQRIVNVVKNKIGALKRLSIDTIPDQKRFILR